jgi:hypothetical protein
MKRVHQVPDDYYVQRDLAREYSVSNDLVRRTTLLSVVQKLEWLRDERGKSGLPIGSIVLCIELVKSMIKELK